MIASLIDRFRQFLGSDSCRYPRRFILVVVLLAVGVVLLAIALTVRSRLPDHNDRHQQAAASDATQRNESKVRAFPAQFRVSNSIDFHQLDDPERDGWDSEVIAAAVQTQLNRLGDALAKSEFNRQHIGRFVGTDVRFESLRPKALEVEFSDGEVRVERVSRGAQVLRQAGIDKFIDELRRFRVDVGVDMQLRTKFKIVSVKESERIRTRQIGSIVGMVDGNAKVEQHFTWATEWLRDRSVGENSLKLMSLQVDTFEQTTRLATTSLLADFTASVLGGNDSYARQFLVGFGDWLQQLQDSNSYGILGCPGIVVGDVNNDGLDDLFVCQESGLPNRLYLHKPDGTAVDISQAAKVDWLERTRSALFIDIDNDHDQDLVAAMMGNVVMAANDGTGRFEIKAVIPCGHDTMSICAADYDLDGDLDLHVCVHTPTNKAVDSGSESVVALSRRVVYHDSNVAGANHLFRNESTLETWAFDDVTLETGLDQNNRRFSFAAAWEDYDNDGDQDLYVANDFGRNNLYRNDRNEHGFWRFVDVAAEADAEDSASGMSVTWGDYDRDGRMDLYVSNMFSAAGRRITYNDRFKESTPTAIKRRLQRFARGNTLMRNRRAGVFQDVSGDAGVTMGRWAWGSNFVDLNNDGWDDLVVANGFITGQDDGDL